MMVITSFMANDILNTFDCMTLKVELRECIILEGEGLENFGGVNLQTLFPVLVDFNSFVFKLAGKISLSNSAYFNSAALQHSCLRSRIKNSREKIAKRKLKTIKFSEMKQFLL